MEPKAKAVQLFLLAYITCHGSFTFSIIGPSLQDLQCLFDVKLGEVASLFLVLGVAVAAATLISTFLIKLINIYILMASMMLLYSIGIGIVASTPYIYVAWVGLFTTGFTNGVFYICAMVLLSVFHKGDSYAWHILSTSVALGSFLGPLIATPFMGITDSISSGDNASSQHLNEIYSSNISMDVSRYCGLEVSYVNVLYGITGVFALPALLGVWLFRLLVKPKVDDISVPVTNFCHIDTNGISVTKTIYTLLVVLSFPMAYGLAFAYGSYLTIIGVSGPLHLGIQKSALMTSIFWLMFLIGRVTSTCLSNYIKQQTIMYISLTGQIISSGVLCKYGSLGEVALWIGTLFLAFMSGPTYACLLTWSRDYITHTPTLLSIFSLMDFAGTTFMPYASGVLISLYGDIAHIYFICALCILEFVLFLAAHGLGMKISKEVKDNDSDMTPIVNGNGKVYESFNDTVEHENK